MAGVYAPMPNGVWWWAAPRLQWSALIPKRASPNGCARGRTKMNSRRLSFAVFGVLAGSIVGVGLARGADVIVQPGQAPVVVQPNQPSVTVQPSQPSVTVQPS